MRNLKLIGIDHNAKNLILGIDFGIKDIGLALIDQVGQPHFMETVRYDCFVVRLLWLEERFSDIKHVVIEASCGDLQRILALKDVYNLSLVKLIGWTRQVLNVEPKIQDALFGRYIMGMAALQYDETYRGLSKKRRQKKLKNTITEWVMTQIVVSELSPNTMGLRDACDAYLVARSYLSQLKKHKAA